MDGRTRRSRGARMTAGSDVDAAMALATLRTPTRARPYPHWVVKNCPLCLAKHVHGQAMKPNEPLIAGRATTTWLRTTTDERRANRQRSRGEQGDPAWRLISECVLRLSKPASLRSRSSAPPKIGLDSLRDSA